MLVSFIIFPIKFIHWNTLIYEEIDLRCQIDTVLDYCDNIAKLYRNLKSFLKLYPMDNKPVKSEIAPLKVSFNGVLCI